MDVIEVRQTTRFSTWLADIRDGTTRAIIARRLSRIALGNLGDQKSVGQGVHELRIHHGSGFRVYFTYRGATIVILLCGGDKDTQDRDIETAKSLAKAL